VTNIIVWWELKVWGLEFSPLTPNILASGGEDGALLVWDLTTPSAASTFPPLKACEIFSPCFYIRFCRNALLNSNFGYNVERAM
jgi:WD40 repeat protein